MDVHDPYERRGVPNPHAYDAEDPEQPYVAANHGYSNVLAPDLTQAERAAERKRLRDREAKRIRPGFYQGFEPRDSG